MFIFHSCVHFIQNCIFIKILSLLYDTEVGKTKQQYQELMKMFQANPYPGKEEIFQAARSLGSSKARIEEWFKTTRKRKRAAGVLHKGEYNVHVVNHTVYNKVIFMKSLLLHAPLWEK